MKQKNSRHFRSCRKFRPKIISGLLGYDAVSFGDWFRTFRRKIVPVSSKVKQSKMNCQHCLNGGDIQVRRYILSPGLKTLTRHIAALNSLLKLFGPWGWKQWVLLKGQEKLAQWYSVISLKTCSLKNKAGRTSNLEKQWRFTSSTMTPSLLVECYRFSGRTFCSHFPGILNSETSINFSPIDMASYPRKLALWNIWLSDRHVRKESNCLGCYVVLSVK
jgi:hypothetical protein